MPFICGPATAGKTFIISRLIGGVNKDDSCVFYFPLSFSREVQEADFVFAELTQLRMKMYAGNTPYLLLAKCLCNLATFIDFSVERSKIVKTFRNMKGEHTYISLSQYFTKLDDYNDQPFVRFGLTAIVTSEGRELAVRDFSDFAKYISEENIVPAKTPETKEGTVYKIGDVQKVVLEFTATQIATESTRVISSLTINREAIYALKIFLNADSRDSLARQFLDNITSKNSELKRLTSHVFVDSLDNVTDIPSGLSSLGSQGVQLAAIQLAVSIHNSVLLPCGCRPELTFNLPKLYAARMFQALQYMIYLDPPAPETTDVSVDFQEARPFQVVLTDPYQRSRVCLATYRNDSSRYTPLVELVKKYLDYFYTERDEMNWTEGVVTIELLASMERQAYRQSPEKLSEHDVTLQRDELAHERRMSLELARVKRDEERAANDAAKRLEAIKNEQLLNSTANVLQLATTESELSTMRARLRMIDESLKSQMATSRQDFINERNNITALIRNLEIKASELKREKA